MSKPHTHPQILLLRQLVQLRGDPSQARTTGRRVVVDPRFRRVHVLCRPVDLCDPQRRADQEIRGEESAHSGRVDHGSRGDYRELGRAQYPGPVHLVRLVHGGRVLDDLPCESGLAARVALCQSESTSRWPCLPAERAHSSTPWLSHTLTPSRATSSRRNTLSAGAVSPMDSCCPRAGSGAGSSPSPSTFSSRASAQPGVSVSSV